VVFYVFDVLVLHGTVMREPLDGRQRLLEKKVLPKLKEPCRYTGSLDAELRDLVGSVKAQGVEVEDMRFSADSRDLFLLHGRIIGGLSAEFNLTSHRVLARDVIDSACKRVLRNMTAQEWLRFLGSEPYRLTCPAVDDAPN
jgi:hypothetical protein